MSTNSSVIKTGGQIEGQSSGDGNTMGVASICSAKRRLEENAEDNGMDAIIIDESPLAKIPKRDPIPSNNAAQIEDSVNLEASSSDFLATSILARTLLTNSNPKTTTSSNIIRNSSSTISLPPTTSLLNDPSLSPPPLIESSSTAKLESMVQQLEQQQQPSRPVTPFTMLPPLLNSIEELRSLSSGPTSLSDPEFDSFLSNGKSPISATRMTILSPIDAVADLVEDDDEEWTLLNSVTKFKTSSSTEINKSSNSSSSSSTSSLAKALNGIPSCQNEITEDENGKSYFNLGASDTLTVARKNSNCYSSASFDGKWNSCNGNGGNSSNKTGESNGNSDDASSTSSSCDSISSEDLFNSCEDFDPSDDDDDDDDEEEEDERNYKQMRSNILHLSLCKLNMFRTQQCVEPSLHRSVLICNTLRHIEQEIRTEDEIRQDEAFLKSREKLPSFWPRTNHHHHVHHHQNGGNGNNRLDSQQHCTTSPPRPPPLPSLTVATTSSANSIAGPSSSSSSQLMTNNEPPYLSPNPYNNNNNESSTTQPPLFSSYDYGLLRPSQTPFHSVSYDEYSSPLEQNHLTPSSMIPNNNSNCTTMTSNSTILPELVDSMSPAPSTSSSSMNLFECDSGYGEDLDLSSYYFGNSIASTTAPSTATTYQYSTNCTENSSNTSTLPTNSSVNPQACSMSPYFNNSNSSSSDNSSDSMSIPSPSNSMDSDSSLPTPAPSKIPTPSDISKNGNSRILLTNCHPSSSVEIELCSNHILRNEYNNNTSNNNSSISKDGTGIIATTTTIWSSSANNLKISPTSSPTPAVAGGGGSSMANLVQHSFAQQGESQQQCGMESRLTDFGLHNHMNGHHSHSHSPHHQHILPMDI